MKKISTKSSALNHLNQIIAGLPVDWPAARRSLVKVGVTEKLIDIAFTSTPYSDRAYKVEICCKDTLLEIKQQIESRDLGSRAGASVAGNSHKTPVNGAMLVTWHAKQPFPDVRIFTDNRDIPVPQKKNILIIENEECFLNKEDTYQFAAKYCGLTIPIEAVEFVYGSGNSITNRRIIPYLKATSGQVLCLFDLDLGGLRIYANLLKAGLSPACTKFLFPSDLEDRLKASKRKATQDELEKLDQVYGVTTETDLIITAIRHYQTTIEQESYRA
jgi:hypothetical protein